MDKTATIQELLNQAANTRKLVLEVAAAYMGCPLSDVILSRREKEGD